MKDISQDRKDSKPARGASSPKRSERRSDRGSKAYKGDSQTRRKADMMAGPRPSKKLYKSRTVKPDYSRNPDQPTIDESVHGVRINKFLASFDIASRRTIDQWIDEGRIRVNGKIAEAGQRVRRSDDIRVDGQPINKRRPKRVYILLNKPRGIICTTDAKVRGNVADYLGLEGRIYPVGRLDKDSTGLLLLTNDGRIVNPILRGQFAHRKVYEVTVDRPITDAFCRRMSEGVRILGQKTKPTEVEPMGSHQFRITLVQGLNRQIRRMCEALGYEVVALKRTQIMHLGIQGLPEGMWRELTHGELEQLEQLLEENRRALEAAQVEAEFAEAWDLDEE